MLLRPSRAGARARVARKRTSRRPQFAPVRHTPAMAALSPAAVAAAAVAAVAVAGVVLAGWAGGAGRRSLAPTAVPTGAPAPEQGWRASPSRAQPHQSTPTVRTRPAHTRNGGALAGGGRSDAGRRGGARWLGWWRRPALARADRGADRCFCARAGLARETESRATAPVGGGAGGGAGARRAQASMRSRSTWLVTMSSRRGATSLPISSSKISLARSASLICTRRSVRRDRSMVVSAS